MLSINILRQRQAWPLEAKILHANSVIREFYNKYEGNIYVSFSGGKDSTVLLDIVRRLYPNTEAVFADTGLEYPEIREFVKTIENVRWVKPKETFKDVIEKHGIPLLSKKIARMISDCQNPTDKNEASRKCYMEGIKKNGDKATTFKIPKKYLHLIDSGIKVSGKCCDITKKSPMKVYEKETGNHAIIGTMAHESEGRRMAYLQTGCNDWKGGHSLPLSIFTEEDIWNYIKENSIEYCNLYDTGITRTGCMFCCFGVHLEGDNNRFKQMRATHPKQYDYCINKLGIGEALDAIGVEYK